MANSQRLKHVVVVTPEQALLLGIWRDYWLDNSKETYSKLYKYLREHKLIDHDGVPYKWIEI